jgi:hypothetical protein
MIDFVTLVFNHPIEIELLKLQTKDRYTLYPGLNFHT